MRTLAGSAIADARHTFRCSAEQAPLHRNTGLDEVGRSGLYLISDLSAGVTGEVHHVDCGYHAIGMPHPNRMNTKGESGGPK
jgi:enoyl-[acyl-carrier protein] reductase I